MPYLAYLDVSSNQLETFLDLPVSPTLLRTLIYRDNRLTTLSCPVPFHCRLLVHLDLSHNQITTLANCFRPDTLPNLATLDVSHNALTDTEGLAPLAPSITTLHVRGNQLTDLAGVSALTNLIHLDVSDNPTLDDLAPCETLIRLVRFSASGTALPCPEALVPLSHAASETLQELLLHDTPVSLFGDVALHVCFIFPNLVVLNDDEMTPEIKVRSLNIRGADLTAQRAFRSQYLASAEWADYGGIAPAHCVLLEAAPAPRDLVATTEETVRAALASPDLLSHRPSLCAHLASHAASEVDLLHAAYLTVLGLVLPPSDGNMWRTDIPLLRPEYRDYEAALLGQGGQEEEEEEKEDKVGLGRGGGGAAAAAAGGAWAERASSLLVSLLQDFGSITIATSLVYGFIKPLGSIPGTRWTLPNHCWVAVGLSHEWYLVDPAWAAIPDTDLAFYTAPESFRYTHHPLLERWQLLADTIDEEVFWSMPQLAPAFFSRGLQMPSTVPIHTASGTVSFEIAVPPGFEIRPELLELPDLDNVSPHKEAARKGLPPGSYVFAHALGLGLAHGYPDLVQWRVLARLPETDQAFCIRVSAGHLGSQEPVEVLMIKSIAEGEAPDCGLVLPHAHLQWLQGAATLLEPLPTTHLLEAARLEKVAEGAGATRYVTEMRVRIPGSSRKGLGGSPMEVAVGEPGGYVFTLLEAMGDDVYAGTVSWNVDAEAVCLTVESKDNEGVLVPLLNWDLRQGARRAIRSRSVSPRRPGTAGGGGN